MASTPDHSRNSVLREIIVEHLFVGDLLRLLWRAGITDAEILRSEFDAGGYDLVLSRGLLTRHIQLKTSLLGGKTRQISAGLRLATRPSGCVIWIVVTEDIAFDHFLWFGGAAGKPLPDLSGYKTTRHARANADGFKAERPDHRMVPRQAFERCDTLHDLLRKLMGDVTPTNCPDH